MTAFGRRIAGGTALLALAALSVADHAGFFGFHNGDDRSRYDGAVATILSAEDGDTIDIDIPDGPRGATVFRGDRRVTRIHLWGVICPEAAQVPGDAGAHFGREAHDWVRRVAVGRRVRLALDPNRPNRDASGQLRAYVFFEPEQPGARAPDGTGNPALPDQDAQEDAVTLNEQLIAEGLGYADPRAEHVLRRRFLEVERHASREGAGLWAEVRPEQVPDWRRRLNADGAR